MTFRYTGYNFKNTVCFCIRELCTWFTFSVSNRKCLIYWNTIHLIKDDIQCLTGAWKDRCSLSLLLFLLLLVIYKDTGFMMINVHCHWERMSLWEYVLYLFTYCSIFFQPPYLLLDPIIIWVGAHRFCPSLHRKPKHTHGYHYLEFSCCWHTYVDQSLPQ